MLDYKPLTVVKTQAALIVYDAGLKDREAALGAVRTDDDYTSYLADEQAALDMVGEAFYEDTKDRNSRESAMAADLSFKRMLVARYGE